MLTFPGGIYGEQNNTLKYSIDNFVSGIYQKFSAERVTDMKKKIAMFTTGWGSEILVQFITGMLDELKSENTDIFLFLCYAAFADSPEKKMGEMNIFNLPDLHDFDGAVIFGSGLDYRDRIDNIISRCKEADIPVIIQGAKIDGISYIGSDNYQAVKDLCAHVVEEHGAKKITFFAGTHDSQDSELRLKAVRDYLKEHDLEDNLKEVFYSNWEMSAVARRINEICANGEELPDVFICANDGIAMEACITLTDNGYEVPRDVLVTGVDHIDAGKIFDPSIATVDQCFDQMGAASVKTWRELMKDNKLEINKTVPCRFIPGESCNCREFRNSDRLRRQICRDMFSNRARNTYFNRKLDIIDSTILSCITYLNLKESLNQLLKDNHVFEGESFHMLLEPNFGLSIYDSNIKLNTDRYSRYMDVIYSADNGVIIKDESINTGDLIPGYTDDGTGHLYMFLPLFEADNAYGYLIFKDRAEELGEPFIRNYCNRMSMALEKFRYALTIDHINQRLLDLMGRDPLTNVNNRMAFEDKEKNLQSDINSDPDTTFALAMFDVNSLKLINDSQGHEAGDSYLIRACRLICNAFKHSPVYRLGGDEFMTVLTGEDFDNREALIRSLNEAMSPYTETLPLPPEYVSIACGMAVFNSSTDRTVIDVIKRADEAMYKDKASKKGTA